MATGTYTGDGAAQQAIAGLGFQPTSVTIYPHVDNVIYGPGHKNDQMGVNAGLWYMAANNWRYTADQVISLDADGFTVGDGTPLANFLNVNLRVYSFVAFG